MSRDFKFFAVGAAECRALAWEIWNDDTGLLIDRFGARPSSLYASLPYHFAFDGRFRVVAIAVLRDGDSVVRERIIDTRWKMDREIDFLICAAPADRAPKPGPGWEEEARRRTDDNLREAFR